MTLWRDVAVAARGEKDATVQSSGAGAEAGAGAGAGRRCLLDLVFTHVQQSLPEVDVPVPDLHTRACNIQDSIKLWHTRYNVQRASQRLRFRRALLGRDRVRI